MTTETDSDHVLQPVICRTWTVTAPAPQPFLAAAGPTPPPTIEELRADARLWPEGEAIFHRLRALLADAIEADGHADSIRRWHDYYVCRHYRIGPSPVATFCVHADGEEYR